jgi:hypothetical protein
VLSVVKLDNMDNILPATQAAAELFSSLAHDAASCSSELRCSRPISCKITEQEDDRRDVKSDDNLKERLPSSAVLVISHENCPGNRSSRHPFEIVPHRNIEISKHQGHGRRIKSAR